MGIDAHYALHDINFAACPFDCIVAMKNGKIMIQDSPGAWWRRQCCASSTTSTFEWRIMTGARTVSIIS